MGRIFWGMESKYFCELNDHRRTLSGRKVCDPDKKEKKNNHKNSGHYVPAATPNGSTRALLRSKYCTEDLFGPFRCAALFTQQKNSGRSVQTFQEDGGPTLYVVNPNLC